MELVTMSRYLDRARKAYCQRPCLETEARYGDLYTRYNKLRDRYRAMAVETVVPGAKADG